jgi:hypothetical protein
MMDIGQALSDPRMFAGSFDGKSWDPWRIVTRGMFALKLTKAERAFFRSVADRDPPKCQVREAWLLCGARAGKDSIASAIATHVAGSFDGRGLRPGERALCACLAVDRTQSSIVLGYIRAYFDEIPALRALVKRATADGLELVNKVDIVVATNDYRHLRGRSVLCAICDEICYWRSEFSSNPDLEVVRAISPRLTLPGSILIGISTVYRRAGVAYERWRKFYGSDTDSVLVIKAPTRVMNPLFPQSEVDAAMASDPEAARGDFLSEWRDDLASYISRDLIEACVDRGVARRPFRQGVRYVSWFDSGGGRYDSFACGITHREGDLAVEDAHVEVRAPFDTSAAVARVAGLLREYRLAETMGDDYGAGFVVAEFRRNGIRCLDRPSGMDRSALYMELLPVFHARKARLLDDERAVSQFAELERRPMSSGHDKVDHPNRTGHHDDLANAIAGALWRATAAPQPLMISETAMANIRMRGLQYKLGRRSSLGARFGPFG